jgi:tRNA 2-thiouridine synthesizing protein A
LQSQGPVSAEPQVNCDRELDARGLNCPLPILRTKRTLNDMTTGQLLKIVATDPGSVRDFEAFCKQTGNQLVFSHENGAEYVFMLCKK